MSRVNDLNDSCFVLATDLIAKLCDEFRDELGSNPTIEELAELLASGIQSCSRDVLADIDPQSLVSLTAKVARKGKARPELGDVVAVPAGDGAQFLMLYLGKNKRYGEAFGLLRGRFLSRPLSSSLVPEPLARPVFTTLHPLISGRWKVVASRPEWLALFPAQPEYYHSKRHHSDDDHIGPHGSAETANDYADRVNRADIVDYSGPGGVCVLRHLSAEECAELGLNNRDFFQCGIESEVEAHLRRLHARKSAAKPAPGASGTGRRRGK